MDMNPALTHFLYIGITAFVAAAIIIAAHICVLILAPSNIELGKIGKIVWPILAVVFLFVPVFFLSPIPFYFFFAHYERRWRFFGAIVFLAFIALDGILGWAHIATDYNYNRSVALSRFLPPAPQGWTATDLPGPKPFISIALTAQASAVRTYTDANGHQVMILIASSPIAAEANRMFHSYAGPRMTADLAKENGITIKDTGYGYIQDCLVVFDKSGQALKEPALVMLAGDYTIFAGSATESTDTLEQLLHAINVYELRRTQP
jgi:hypothetical protein